VDFSLSAPAITTLATVGGTSTVTVNTINGVTGIVVLSPGLAPSGCSSSITGLTLSVACSDGVAPFSIVVSGQTGSAPNGLTRTVSVGVTIQDFSLAPNPATISLTTTAASTSTISDSPVNGFSQMISYSAGTVPAGCSASVSGATLSVVCNPLPTTGFSVAVMGTAGTSPNTLMRTATVQVMVGGGFTLSSSRTSITTLASIEGSSALTLTPLGTFSGTVTLSTGSVPLGCTATLTSAAIIPPILTDGLSVICSTGISPFNLTITGVSGGMSSSLVVPITVQDFSIAVDNSGPVDVGDSAVVTITLTPINSFSGSTVLFVDAPPGLTCGSVTPPSLVLPSQTASTVTCTSNTSGNYTLTVSAGSGSMTPRTAKTTISVNPVVNPSPIQPEIAGLDPALFYGIVGVVIVSIIGAIVAVARRSRKPR